VSVRALLGLISAEINLTCEYLIETDQCFNVYCKKRQHLSIECLHALLNHSLEYVRTNSQVSE
jgi:hypothetical protein